MSCRVVSSTAVAWIVLVAAAVSQSVGAQATSGSALSPLQQVLAALASYRTIDMQATARMEMENRDSGGGDDTLVSNLAFEVRRSGPETMVSIKEVVDRPGVPTWQGQRDSIVERDGDVTFRQAQLDESMHQMEGSDGLGFTLASERISGQNVDREEIYNQLNDAGAALWIIGYAPLSDYLARNATVTADQGRTKIVSETDFGTLTIVTSESSGWLPTSFEVIKQPSDRTIGGNVKTVYQGAVKAVSWSGTATGYSSDSAGRWAPSSITVTRRVQWTGKPVETCTTSIGIKQVEFAPKLSATDFESSIEIPSGFAVAIVGATQGPYEWNGSQVVPAIGPFNSPDSTPGGRGWGALGKVLLAGNVVLVLVLTLLLWRRSVRRNALRS